MPLHKAYASEIEQHLCDAEDGFFSGAIFITVAVGPPGQGWQDKLGKCDVSVTPEFSMRETAMQEVPKGELLFMLDRLSPAPTRNESILINNIISLASDYENCLRRIFAGEQG